MKNKHLIFIVNEFSRNGKKTTHQIRQVMQRSNSTYEIHITQYPKHATVLAEHLADKVENDTLIVAVGGDGTLNEAVQGLLNVDAPIPLAYIATGSGNDFARSLGLPLTIEASVNNILDTDSPTYLDVLIGTSDYSNIVAVNSIGFGLDGMVINKIDKTKNKQTIGKFSYLASVLSAYFSQKAFPLKLVTDKQNYIYGESLLIVCTNNKFFGGGIPIHPEAVATDGMIDLVIAEKVSFKELLSILFSILTTQSHLKHPKLHSHRVASCSFTLYTPQYGQRDGELIEKNIQNMSVRTVKRPFWI
ncbi:diacylglycerol kinase family protein [Alkalibacterium putridalgicola]|uniref:diacylglycerol/lipid kinase family protein n=1 Tax=Alkalibacterium putridalgicola TaxID=426703 RepID=UPI0034CDE5CE